MTRRELFAAMAAGTLHARPRMDMSRISVITDEASKSPAEAIAFCKQYGLQWVELREVPGGKGSYTSLPEPALREAAKEFAGNGIRVSFLDAGLYKFGIPGTEVVRRTPEKPEAREKRLQRDAAQFARRAEDLKRALNAAHILGASQVRVFGFSRVAEPLKMLPRVAEILGEMVEIAGKEKVRLLIENEGSCNVATSAELAAMARLIPSKWFGLNWDALNGTGQKEIPFPDGYKLLPMKRVGNVHIKGRSILDGPQKMDWAAVFKTFLKDGYKGHFGLETHIFGPTQVASSHASMKEIRRIVESMA